MTWPHTLSAERAKFASAALRHVSDAASLVSTSPMGAYYLAGYGPECARKAALTWPDAAAAKDIDKAIGHGFHKQAELALDHVLAVDPLATRYELPRWRLRFRKLAEWREDRRYESSQMFGAAAARGVLGEANEVVTEVIAALWADGRLPPLDELTKVKP